MTEWRRSVGSQNRFRLTWFGSRLLSAITDSFNLLISFSPSPSLLLSRARFLCIGILVLLVYGCPCMRVYRSSVLRPT